MKKMRWNHFIPLLAGALFVTASAAQAAVHTVYPGQSIQEAIDEALPGDTILVEPGTYSADAGSTYGLHITKDNLRLIGKVKKGLGEAGKVRLVYEGEFYDPENYCLADEAEIPPDEERNDEVCDGGQRTGIFAAPVGCEFEDDLEDCEARIGEFENLQGFYVRGFSVEGFPRNGIQTRWVDDFEFADNTSVNNLNNGIYPTLSANGMVRNNESYGSLDTAMWIAASENVRVIGNDLHGSVIGFEITVSNDVLVKQNKMYDNTVGVGLFHPNGAGNPPKPVMANWVIEHNDIYDNNRPNEALEGTFQESLPSGAGVLLVGVSDHVVAKNNVKDNDFVGIAVLGWCTALAGGPRDCGDGSGLRWPPEALNNLITQNYLSGNGGSPPDGAPFPPVDLLYLQFEVDADESGNCFEKNKPKSGLTTYAAYPSAPPPAGGPLPTAGC